MLAMFRALRAAALVVAGLLSGREARADSSPYRLKWEIDAPIVTLGLAGIAGGLLAPSSPTCVYPCSVPSGMNGLDRLSVGNYSREAHAVANATVLSLLSFAVVLEVADHPDAKRVVTDLAVIGEAVVLTQGITQTVKSLVRRPAPFTHRESGVEREDLESGDAFRSFISGHTSTSFSVATAVTTTFWLRHPKSDARWLVLGATHLAALTVALLKIEAGYHYPTDVAAGAIVGTSIGLLVPMLHRNF